MILKSIFNLFNSSADFNSFEVIINKVLSWNEKTQCSFFYRIINSINNKNVLNHIKKIVEGRINRL